METLFVGIAAFVFVYFIYKRSNKNNISTEFELNNAVLNNVEVNSIDKNNSNGITIRYDSKIPKGFQILFDIRDIPLGYKIKNAKDFVDSNNHTLTLAPEPSNKYDSNAIAVLSYSGLLGYIPKDIAKEMYRYNFKDKNLKIRIMYIWVGDKRAKLDIQILGKKEEVKEFKK